MANAERFCCLTKASMIGCRNRRTEMMQVDIFCSSNWHMFVRLAAAVGYHSANGCAIRTAGRRLPSTRRDPEGPGIFLTASSPVDAPLQPISSDRERERVSGATIAAIRLINARPASQAGAGQ